MMTVVRLYTDRVINTSGARNILSVNRISFVFVFFFFVFVCYFFLHVRITRFRRFRRFCFLHCLLYSNDPTISRRKYRNTREKLERLVNGAVVLQTVEHYMRLTLF